MSKCRGVEVWSDNGLARVSLLDLESYDSTRFHGSYMRRSPERDLKIRIQEKRTVLRAHLFFSSPVGPVWCGLRASDRVGSLASWWHLLPDHGSSLADCASVKYSEPRRLAHLVSGADCAWPSSLASPGTNP